MIRLLPVELGSGRQPGLFHGQLHPLLMIENCLQPPDGSLNVNVNVKGQSIPPTEPAKGS